MASSLSRSLYRAALLSGRSRRPYHLSLPCCTKFSSASDSHDFTLHQIDPLDSQPSSDPTRQRIFSDRPLENGLDLGIYKAILVGPVGQTPIQKKLKSGRTVTLLSVGTGGIRNNRRPLDNEKPREYANRCSIQWHRVSVYPEKLGDVAMKHVIPGSILYLEGNLETKIFSDPITGLVRRIREIAIRQNGMSKDGNILGGLWKKITSLGLCAGRLVFLGKGSGDSQQSTHAEMKAVGYY